MTRGAGALLSWRVEVEGQANAMPLSSFAAPSLDTVQFTLFPNVTRARCVLR
jgi:hypothetical protein